MVKIIKDFVELNLPMMDGDAGDDWCMSNKYTAPSFYYLLNDNSNTLGDLLTGLKQHQFYFDSEVECHSAGTLYYEHHGHDYPYNSHYLRALRAVRDKGSDSSNDVNIIESQTMEFE